MYQSAAIKNAELTDAGFGLTGKPTTDNRPFQLTIDS